MLYVQNANSYTEGSAIRYATYRRMITDINVHVPNVRADNGVTWVWKVAAGPE